jgi:lipocalin
MAGPRRSRRSTLAKVATGVAAATAAIVGMTATPAQAQNQCPPPGFDSMQNFNVTKYTGPDRWYSQEQMEVQSLPAEYNYCTAAEYTILTPTSVSVFNQARIGAVDGPPTQILIQAIIEDPSQPSKLSVGPFEVPPQFYGPYWVLAAGPDVGDRYEWALISGGPPTISTENGCRTKQATVNGSGLWIFSRVPFPDPAQVDEVRNMAKQLGLDISVLNKVEHRGCNYTVYEPRQ